MNPPKERPLKKPYFLLRTPDGLGSYLNRECRRILLSPKEPLAEFLAPVTAFDESSNATISYSLDRLELEDVQPLEHIPPALLKQFESAVNAFLNNGAGANQRISDHEKKLREGFRLPDPELEPDAYWIYGPIEKRRLLIIWGCEYRQNSSLPLRSANPDKPGLLEKLKANKPSWIQTQRDAARLIHTQNLPLASYLAKPVPDATGTTARYLVQGKAIEAKACKAALKGIPANLIPDFRSAATQQLSLAVPDATDGLDESAKDLIKAFQLPDPDLKPECYILHKDGFFILLEENRIQEEHIYPVESLPLNIPPQEQMPDGTITIPDTVCDKLSRKAIKSRRMPMLIASACAALIVVALGLAYFLSDRNPPEILDVIARDEPERILIIFNEAIHPDSLKKESSPPFRIRHEGGHFIQIEAVELAPQAPNKVVLTVETLEERPYVLKVQGIRDLSRNAIEETLRINIIYRDTIPPEVAQVSAHPENQRQLLIKFSKPIDSVSANPTSFTIPGFSITEARLAEDNHTVTLTTREPFVNGREYSIDIRGIRDISRERNPILNVDALAFQYIDTIPPAVERVAADQNQITIRVFFSKAVDQSTATTPDNYIITALMNDQQSEVIPLRSARLLGDNRVVDLHTVTPLRNAIPYQLTVTGVKDRANPPNVIKSAEAVNFLYEGREDNNPPSIAQVLIDASDQSLLFVTFNKPVKEASAIQPEAYRVEDLPVGVLSVEPTRDPNTVALRLAEPLQGPATHHLRVTGVEDLLGNKILEEKRSPAFEVRGIVSYANDLVLEQLNVSPAGNSITLEFLDPLVSGPATTITNFQLSGNLRISKIEASPPNAPTTLTLSLDPSTSLKPGVHSIRISNQRLEDDPSAIQAPVTREFRF